MQTPPSYCHETHFDDFLPKFGVERLIDALCPSLPAPFKYLMPMRVFVDEQYCLSVLLAVDGNSYLHVVMGKWCFLFSQCFIIKAPGVFICWSQKVSRVFLLAGDMLEGTNYFGCQISCSGLGSSLLQKPSRLSRSILQEGR